MEFSAIRRKLHEGFTLIELTVVLFLIGLFLAIAVPNIDDFLFHSDLTSTARSLKATVRVLRSKSIATGRYALLSFDLDQGTYRGELEPAPKAPRAFMEEQKNELIVPERSLPKGIRFVDAMNVHSKKM